MMSPDHYITNICLYNFNIDTSDSELPIWCCSNFLYTGHLYFLSEEYKNIVEFQTEWIHSLNTWRDREFNPDDFFPWKDGSMWTWVY